ncbi:hypothetical protein RFI_40194 [Reticulomyxa filosa]|uniref:Uncharacterized protein n=1 Tax=Reticulomyxa filosa TaxID=46433 RepID=X6L715_RETFI|nr:hypothetical protein RFI_40194 [Reticulomyxa filosa]|eukprot:ETN97337.1 hypothetical protein RFI_40194 [Reticulomyxa filosa]
MKKVKKKTKKKKKKREKKKKRKEKKVGKIKKKTYMRMSALFKEDVVLNNETTLSMFVFDKVKEKISDEVGQLALQCVRQVAFPEICLLESS